MTTNTGHEVALPSHIDVEADARVIKSVADKTIQTILNKRAEMDRAGLQDEPLIVVHGENHTMTGHKLHLMAVLDGLNQARESCLMAFETQHDLLIQDYAVEGGYRRTVESDNALRRQDRERAGALTLQNYKAFYGSSKSDHAHKTVMQYCHQTGTPSVFTDAATRSDGYLDKNDPATRDSIASCRGKLRSLLRISSKEPEGVHVRNHHMLNCARETAKQYDSRIILQQTGNAHVVGHSLFNDEPRHSQLVLSNKFFEAALGHLPVSGPLPVTDDDMQLLERYGVAQEDLSWCRLPQTLASYDSFTDAPKGEADLQCRAAEAEYVGRILQAIGLGAHALSVEAYERQSKLDQQDLQQCFAAINRQTQAQPVAKPA